MRKFDVFVDCYVFECFELYEVVPYCFEVVVEVLVGVGVNVVEGVEVIKNFMLGFLIKFYLICVYNVVALQCAVHLVDELG